MAADDVIAEFRRELGEMRTENNQQFQHGRKHFEVLEEEMKIFRSIISNMNEGVLEGVNERAAYIDAMMARSQFWSDLRDELTRKTVMIAFLCLISGVVFWLGFEDTARKLIGL